MTNRSTRHGARMLRSAIRRWVTPVADYRQMLTGLANYPRFAASWFRYASMPGAERLSLWIAQPELHDRTATSPLDAHYFYSIGWAVRRTWTTRPDIHVDIGSNILFCDMLSAMVPVVFVDIRPLEAQLSGLYCVAGSILHLPFRDRSVRSLSCLHVAEHIGLGRYGDPLDPAGTRKAARELSRCLAVGGTLTFALPVGRSRVLFNAHRIHSAHTIRSYFPDLDLVEFSCTDDTGAFREHAPLSTLDSAVYGCGMFRFVRTTE